MRCSQFFAACGGTISCASEDDQEVVPPDESEIRTNSCDCAIQNLRQIKHMKRFEYDVVYMKTEVSDASSQGSISHHVRKVLNAMGKDGWELVSVAQDQEQIRLFLKRELPSAKA
jgi:hypothetical protein